MMLDALATFVAPTGAPVSLVQGGASTGFQIGNVIDLLGTGPGQAPPSIIGTATTFGQDPDIGLWTPEVQINVGAALASGGTMEFAVQYAPDTAGTYQPGTWVTGGSTGPHAAAAFAINAIFRMRVPPTPPEQPRPRYMRLAGICSAAVTAGTVTSAFIVQGRDDWQNKYAANNYTVA